MKWMALGQAGFLASGLALAGPAGSAPFAYVSRIDPAVPVSVVDLASRSTVAGIVAPVPVRGIAVGSGGSRLYTTYNGGISVIDTATNSVVAGVLLPGNLQRAALDRAGSRLHVVDEASGSLVMVNIDKLAVEGTVPVGAGPRGVAVSSSGTRAYVTNRLANTITVIDPAAKSIVATIPVGTEPIRIALNPGGTRAYVVNRGSNSVSVIDTVANAVVATVPVPGNPSDIALDPLGVRAYVARAASSIAMIDTRSLAVTDSAALLGGATSAITLDPDGAKAYVVHGGQSLLSVVDAASLAGDGIISLGDFPTDIAIAPADPQLALVYSYYRTILGRAPDGGGRAFWRGHAMRMQGLGADVRETFFTMAKAFFGSPEYRGFARDDGAYATDVYNTFFLRAPDPAGLAYWVGNLQRGMPREVVLAGFMFSPEFSEFAAGALGGARSRAEVDVVMDFYRGLLGRLPDDGGFDFWVQRFRSAQCAAVIQVVGMPNPVVSAVEAISGAFATSAEYAGRARTDVEYVGDLYDAFLRRGGDLGGVQFWLGELSSGRRTREDLRREFVASPEFAARVGAVIAQGCLP